MDSSCQEGEYEKFKLISTRNLCFCNILFSKAHESFLSIVKTNSGIMLYNLNRDESILTINNVNCCFN